jgi:SPP1 gp7 family putative phage head morphogenesis protein
MELVDRFSRVLDSLVITDPYEIIEALTSYVTRTPAFRDLARSAASRMVTGLMHDGARSWREAARSGMRGRDIYAALRNELKGPVGIRVQQLVDENAELISTFPDAMASRVNTFIERESQKGRRAEAIARDLQEQFPDVSRSRINLIARTETSKASTALTRSRAESLGLDWYVWRTSKDARVRDSHEIMDRVLVNWNDPPSPEALNDEKSHGNYHAGNIFNCRCYPAPVIDLGRVKWPSKVYTGGQIQQMTRARFERMSGHSRAA